MNMCTRCTRCGQLFELVKKAHARLEHNKMYDVKLEEEWPRTSDAGNINDQLQERIREQLSARGYKNFHPVLKVP